jgi:V/A-type H+-transporting ATPase subunit I
MYKYSFLVYHAGYSDFLSEIRKLGVLHIDQKVKEPTPEMQELYRQIKDIELTVKKLDWFKEKPESRNIAFDNGEAIYLRMKYLEKEEESLQHHRARLEKEESQLEPWGNFDWNNLQKLEEPGLEFRFFTCSAKKFQTQWQVEHAISLINDESGIYYFIKIDRRGENSPEFLDEPGVEQIYLPQSSLSNIREEVQLIRAKQQNIHTELLQIAAFYKDKLVEYCNKVRDEVSGKDAHLQTTDQLDGKVMLIEGYVPETKKDNLDHYLEKNNILALSALPDMEEKVPILLKNNRFARLYEVIGRLYDLPNHTELDLVPYFAPFYMMFFGFCMGDAGYGMLMVLVGTFAKRKFPEMKDILTLAQWLGLATIIFGFLSGTFFGIPLMDANIPWLEGAKKFMLDFNKLFYLALIFGVIQILFGMILKVFNIRKSQGIRYSFSTIGWLVLILGSGILMGAKYAGWISQPAAGIVQNVILGVSGILIFLLNHPKRNILVNIGAGLWDAYGMVSGIFGDLLSYIRLFALCISGGILGFVFNKLASSLSPDNIILGPLVMIIILVIGHSINIFMCALGAFVHPMRLTFVEFFKNAGFNGGGKPYTPFVKHVSEVTI